MHLPWCFPQWERKCQKCWSLLSYPHLSHPSPCLFFSFRHIDRVGNVRKSDIHEIHETNMKSEECMPLSRACHFQNEWPSQQFQLFVLGRVSMLKETTWVIIQSEIVFLIWAAKIWTSPILLQETWVLIWERNSGSYCHFKRPVP